VGWGGSLDRLTESPAGESRRGGRLNSKKKKNDGRDELLVTNGLMGRGWEKSYPEWNRSGASREKGGAATTTSCALHESNFCKGGTVLQQMKKR